MLGSRVAQAALIVSTILCLFPAQTGAAICPPFTIHGNIGSGSPDSPSILAVREDRVFRNAVSSCLHGPEGVCPLRHFASSPLSTLTMGQVSDPRRFASVHLGEPGRG